MVAKHSSTLKGVAREKGGDPVSSYIINIVEPPVRQRRSLLQPQVSADEQLSSGDRRGVLHVCQTLHHHGGHPLGKQQQQQILRSALAEPPAVDGPEGPALVLSH